MAIKTGTRVHRYEQVKLVLLVQQTPGKWREVGDEAETDEDKEFLTNMAKEFERGGHAYKLVERTVKTRVQVEEKVISGEGAEEEGNDDD